MNSRTNFKFQCRDVANYCQNLRSTDQSFVVEAESDLKKITQVEVCYKFEK